MGIGISRAAMVKGNHVEADVTEGELVASLVVRQQADERVVLRDAVVAINNVLDGPSSREGRLHVQTGVPTAHPYCTGWKVLLRICSRGEC